MYVTTITIGRNVTSTPGINEDPVQVPMPDERWSAFKVAAAALLTEAVIKTQKADGVVAPFYYEQHSGIGVWDGVEEESFKITTLSDQPMTYRAWLRDELGDLAPQFDQLAIALTVGESELCY